MKKRLLTGFILVFFLSACTSAMNIPTATVDIQTPTVDIQPGMEKTREYFAFQTIVALEQLTRTPTPQKVVLNSPKQWTEITTLKPGPTSTPHLVAMASAVKPNTSIQQGPGLNYKLVCLVDGGVQLLITGRNIDSSWLKVTFGQGQTCFTLDKNSIRKNIIPDPTLQYWILHSACTISGDMTKVAIITPTITMITPTATPTLSPYGAAFLWNDRFNNSEQNREALFERKLYPISLILSITALAIWFGMIIRSSMGRSGHKGAIIHSLLTVFMNLIAGS